MPTLKSPGEAPVIEASHRSSHKSFAPLGGTAVECYQYKERAPGPSQNRPWEFSLMNSLLCFHRSLRSMLPVGHFPPLLKVT